MRPYQILTNLDATPKIAKPASEKPTWRDLLGMFLLILLGMAVMSLTACNMATMPTAASDSLRTVDSVRAADTTRAPASQILGAWKSIDTTDADSLWGIAFLPNGRFVKQVPVFGGLDSCWAEYLGGTWSMGTGSIALTYDSAGVACDSAICWHEEDRRTMTSSFVLHGNTLTIGGTIYRRLSP